MTKAIQQIENNSQTDHFKSIPNKEQKNEVDDKVFELTLVDINKTYANSDIECVKKNMYDPELKYICISYRWGELNEQLAGTPNYTAHITSFDLRDFIRLCGFIDSGSYKDLPRFKEIPYLWIDAISVDQQNHAGKKETILKMNQIYQHATYILAIPDLHLGYLKKNIANIEILELIKEKDKKTIYDEIFNNKQIDISDDDINTSTLHKYIQPEPQQQQINNDNKYSFIQRLKNININEDAMKIIEELVTENKKMEELKIKNKAQEYEIKELKIEKKKEERKKVYQFLAYLIEDWSNRAWVISEYQIAKEKYIKHGTPLRYMFYSSFISFQPFFSYYFNEDDDQHSTIDNNVINYKDVINPILFNQFLKSRFTQRPHLEMILNSNATRNEDRFNAILPSWNKYKHLIKNKNTISDWNITDMTSVRLKLYEIINESDLWEKATLLNACKYGYITPTFASYHSAENINIVEKLDYNNAAYKKFERSLIYKLKYYDCNEADKIIPHIDKYKMDSKSLWNENLTSIQFDKHHCYLSVKSNSYYITNEKPSVMNKYRKELSLDDDDEIHFVFIPFFTSNILGYNNYLLIHLCGSHIFLVGNIDKNKWVLKYNHTVEHRFKSDNLCSDDYTFNIY